MSFLVPLYLLGAAAIVVPIYLHLRRKPPKDAVEFSSLMFLEPTRHNPVKRRSQLENIPLLLLRCLALLLLAAMFGRPFMRGGDEEREAGRLRTVVLLDTSASMQREGLWEAAQEEAREVIDGMHPDGALALVAIDGAPRTVIGFEEWSGTEAPQRGDLARGAFDTLEPGWLSSDLGTGLVAASELIADAATGDEGRRPARIVVISDLQSGASLDAVAEASWPPGLHVELRSVQSDEPTNASLVAAPATDPDRPLVRVRNDPGSEKTTFRLQAGGTTVTAVVPPGESRVIQFEEPVPEVVLSGDEQSYDNRLFLAPREPAPVTLQFLGSGNPDDSNRPEYYFRRAFGLSRVLRPQFVDSLEEEPAILAIARELGAGEVDAVRAQLEAGGRALLVVTSAGMAGTLENLAGLQGAVELREHEGRYALLEGIDFDHPLLGEFRDPRWRDFTEVHFWKFRVLDSAALPESARVVARFDTGDPAWVDIPVGRGNLLVMLSGWHPRDSQLSLSSKFVPLLFSLFADRGPQVSGVRQFFVGEPLPLEEGETNLELPGGDTLELARGEIHRPSKPGLYRVSNGRRTRSFAVNLRPSESDLAPLTGDALAVLGVPVEGAGEDARPPSDTDKRRLRDREAESNQNLWRWAVVILLSMLVIESWLAMRSGRANPEPN